MTKVNPEKTNVQMERLAHIEFKLYFFGQTSRKDLIERFGIKEAAATRDFTKYNELAPKNLFYNPRVKMYQVANEFKPIFDYSTTRVLSTLAEGFGDGLKSLGNAELICESPVLINPPKLEIVAAISRAIVQKKLISIGYSSLSSGNTRREILPFALVDNGLRWHVRAWDRKRSRFSDFVITRIEKAKIIEASKLEPHEFPENDEAWNSFVELKLIPHPKLVFKETIEKDYAMTNGVKSVNIRAALAGYMLRRWNVDCSSNHSLSGPEYHLALENVTTLKVEEDTMNLAPGFEFHFKN